MFDEISEAEKLRKVYLDWFAPDKQYEATNDSDIEKKLEAFRKAREAALIACRTLELSYVALDAQYDAWTERNEY